MAAAEVDAYPGAKQIQWVKNPRQVEALALLQENLHTLLYGGSRSGKTYIIIRLIVLRALARTSRHLIVRLRFNHVKTSVWLDTFPKVMRECFPYIPYQLNKTDWFVTIKSREGGLSEIWIAGTDDPARMEKVLGTEYSSVFFNEISQLAWAVIPTIWARLAESSGLRLRFYYDCNPPFRRHWAYTMFFKAESPDGEPLTEPVDEADPEGPRQPLTTCRLLMNPVDNPSLPAAYMAILNALPLRARERYRDGKFGDDVEGALWTDEMIFEAVKLGATRKPLIKTIVAVDPAMSDSATSSEWGIVVCGLDEDRKGGVLADCSIRESVGKAAQAVVAAYHDFEANYVVAEINQGGDMVEAMIHNVDPGIKVVKVRASKGKFARAEPVAQLYENGEVWHDETMPDLDAQLTTYVPHLKNEPADRLDALVWGLTHLVVGKQTRKFHFG